MAHPNLKDFVKRMCIEMLLYEQKNIGFMPKEIKERCLSIVDNNEYPEWKNEITSEPNIDAANSVLGS